MDTSRTIRILLIDDDQGDFEMTRAMLGQIEGADIDLDWVPSFEEGMDALARPEHDVYLVDYLLEDRDGLALVREARALGVRKPMIMLTGRGSHDVDVEAMRAGASDYLVKGAVDPDRLERSIRYALAREAAEEALRESEERHRGMFDHLPIGLYRTSPEGELRDANPALLRILGYPDSATLREAYASNLFVNPADRGRFGETLDRYGVARGFETRLRRPDGSTVLVRNTARAHRGADGRIVYVEGAVEDVTELGRAALLRQGAERFRVIFDGSNLPILLVDLPGRVMEANPAFRRAFGYGESETSGRPLVELVVEEERTVFTDAQRKLTEGGAERIQAERHFLGRDGTVLRTRCTCSLVTDAEGAPDHVMVLIEDVVEAGERTGSVTP